jgi:hypothetical protein
VVYLVAGTLIGRRRDDRVVHQTLQLVVAVRLDPPDADLRRVRSAPWKRRRLISAQFALSRGDSFEIREGHQPVLVPRPGDPDAAADAEGAALPNPGAKLAAPSFEEWLAAA